MFADIFLELAPDRSVVLVEEEVGEVKRLFFCQVAAQVLQRGMRVTYFTTGYRDEVESLLTKLLLGPPAGIDIFDQITGVDEIAGPSGDLWCVDAVTTLLIDAELDQVLSFARLMADESRKGRTILLGADRGIMQPRHEQVLRVFADGVIQFTATPEEDRIRRYLMVPKMKGSTLAEKLLIFNITDEGLLIDTRERHG